MATEDNSTLTPAPPTSRGSTAEVLAATIAAAVERQLTQYVSAMAQQVEVARRAAEQSKADLRVEFENQLAELARQHESELDELARRQEARIREVEERVAQSPVGESALDHQEIENLREQMDSQSASTHARIDELQRATRRFDEQAAALVQHVNDTTIALAQRMDDGNQALASAVEERLNFVRATLEAVGPEVHRQLTEQATAVTGRIEFSEHRMTDRLLALEERINEEAGGKIANLEATIGRIGAGFDDAIAAMSHRLLEVENNLDETILKLGTLQEQVNKVDENAIKEVKEQLSATVGEAMLVRIEMERYTTSTEEKLDKNAIRMAEIEAKLEDDMDVSTAVQLERLEELERAIVALNPDQFVRRTDPDVSLTSL